MLPEYGRIKKIQHTHYVRESDRTALNAEFRPEGVDAHMDRVVPELLKQKRTERIESIKGGLARAGEIFTTVVSSPRTIYRKLVTHKT